jgi:hypothetical protein
VKIAGDDAVLNGDVVVIMINVETNQGAQAVPDVFGHYEGELGVELSCAHPVNHVRLFQQLRAPSGSIDSPDTFVTVPRLMPEASTCTDGGVPEDGGVAEEAGSSDGPSE